MSTRPQFICANCRIQIAGPATFHVGLAFCCAGCVAGGPCTCSYDPEDAFDEGAVRHCLDVAELAEVPWRRSWEPAPGTR